MPALPFNSRDFTHNASIQVLIHSLHSHPSAVMVAATIAQEHLQQYYSTINILNRYSAQLVFFASFYPLPLPHPWSSIELYVSKSHLKIFTKNKSHLMFSNKTLNHISQFQRLSSHTSLYAKIFSQHHIYKKAKLDSTKKKSNHNSCSSLLPHEAHP